MCTKKTCSLANGTIVKAWGCIFGKISVDFLLNRLSCLGWRCSQVEGGEEEGGERKGLDAPVHNAPPGHRLLEHQCYS